jgi:hypothetical protein
MCPSKRVCFKVMMKQGCRCGIKVPLEALVPNCLKENIVTCLGFFMFHNSLLKKEEKTPLKERRNKCQMKSFEGFQAKRFKMNFFCIPYLKAIEICKYKNNHGSPRWNTPKGFRLKFV